MGFQWYLSVAPKAVALRSTKQTTLMKRERKRKNLLMSVARFHLPKPKYLCFISQKCRQLRLETKDFRTLATHVNHKRVLKKLIFPARKEIDVDAHKKQTMNKMPKGFRKGLKIHDRKVAIRILFRWVLVDI